jgi:hypothetical protein
MHTWIFAQILEQPLLIKPILEIRLAVCRGLELGITRGWGSIRPLALWSRFELDGPTESALYHQLADAMANPQCFEFVHRDQFVRVVHCFRISFSSA